MNNVAGTDLVGNVNLKDKNVSMPFITPPSSIDLGSPAFLFADASPPPVILEASELPKIDNLTPVELPPGPSLTGVLTRENSDPMLSATIVTEQAGNNAPAPPSSAIPTSETLVQSNGNHVNNQVMLPANGSGVVFPGPTPDFKSVFKLLGCFATTLGCPDGSKRSYVINVFDQGCLFTPGTDTHPEVLDHLRSAKGTTFSVICSKQDPSRVTADHITFDFATVSKPGTSQSVLQATADEQMYFLQTTASHKVELYFLKAYGHLWMGPSLLITNVNSPEAKLNEDFVQLATKKAPPTIKSNASTPTSVNGISFQLPTEPLPHSETLHFSSGTLTLHAAATASASASPPPSQSTVASPAAANAKAKVAFQIVSNQYNNLSPEQVFHSTFCTVCKKKFKYVMDHLFHFTMSAPCRASVFNNKHKVGPDRSFYNAFAETIRGRCKLGQEDPSITCDLCSTTLFGPVQYGMHRDQHRPAQGDMFMCQFCSKLFLTPYNFVRHDCIKLWNVVKTIASISDKDPSNPTSSEDAFKIYAKLTDTERDLLLQCPNCSKKHSYMSGIISHFKTSRQCLTAIVQRSGQSHSDDVIDISAIVFRNLPSLQPRSISCEICSIQCQDQLGYAIHRDHHSLRKQGMLICKGCNKEYRAPCEFYRHICANGAKTLPTRLFWCAFCDVSRHCDIARETAKLRAQKQRQQKQTPLKSAPLPHQTTETNGSVQDGTEPKKQLATKSGPKTHLAKLNSKTDSELPKVATQRKRKSLDGPISQNGEDASGPPPNSKEDYLCTDCSPNRILKGQSGLRQHKEELSSHSRINPLWVYNQVKVNLVDVKKRKKSPPALTVNGNDHDDVLTKNKKVNSLLTTTNKKINGIKMDLIRVQPDENKNLS